MYVRERDSKEDSSGLNVRKLPEQHCDGTCMVPQRVSCQHAIGTLAITKRAHDQSRVRLDTPEMVLTATFPEHLGNWGSVHRLEALPVSECLRHSPAGLQLGQFPRKFDPFEWNS
jgi:hypothetical protein